MMMFGLDQMLLFCQIVLLERSIIGAGAVVTNDM